MKTSFSLQALSLKRRIWVAISLVTLIPAIITFYYLNGFVISAITIVTAVLIVFLGWWIIFEVFSSIVKVYYNSKKTLINIGEETPAVTNEVQSLESIIDILSSKMKSGLEQLKDFSQKTEELNQEVSKKVFVLSTILQANDLFSKDIPSEEILIFLTQRLKEILGMKLCCFSLKEEASDIFHVISCLGIEAQRAEEILIKESKHIYKLKRIEIYDKFNKLITYSNIVKELEVSSFGICPIISKNQTIGLLAAGSSDENFVFTKDALNILNLFSQNIALIWEHKRLSRRIGELEVADYLTGLYNVKYIEKRLNEETARSMSYQRPCGFLLMKISNYSECQEKLGPIEAEKLVKKTAKIFKESLRPIDIAGRAGPDSLCAILIEKNKRQSQVIASEVEAKLKDNFKEQLKVVFCVAENPIDGTTAKELILFAQSRINTKNTNEIS
ncbi:MAG: diguanylate cyclase [Candidatus Omnitrophota bacterium]